MNNKDNSPIIKIKDVLLLSDLRLFEDHIAKNEANSEYNPNLKERLISSLYIVLLKNIRKHPQFSNKEAFQVSDTHVRLSSGALAEISSVDYELIFTDEDKKEVVNRSDRSNQ